MPDVTLTIAQGYPQNVIQRPDDFGYEYDLRVFYTGALSDVLSQFPAIGALETTWGGIENCYVLTRRFSEHPETSGIATYCDMHCGQSGEFWVLSMEDGGVQRPIEFHKDYRTKWNYHLVMNKNETTYSGFSTDTTPSMSQANSTKFKWVKETSEAPVDNNGGKSEPWMPPSGYTKTKPGVDSYIAPSPIVREFRRFAKLKDAWDAQAKRAAGVVFQKTANYFLEDWTWLTIASGLSFDGCYWNVTITYQGATKGTDQGQAWDVDLYGDAQPQPE